MSRCIECRREGNRESAHKFYHSNRERVLIIKKEWYVKERARLLIYNRERNKSHPRTLTEGQALMAAHATNKRRYGMTKEQYIELYNKQSGVCAICGKPESTIGKKGTSPVRLSVDHSHVTGKIRGLLCKKCNLGIGYLKDDPNVLLSARNYLLSNS